MSMSQFGLGDSQFRILKHLKREGSATIPLLAEETSLTVETVRSHVKSLLGRGLLRRDGDRRIGRGRPEGVYRLTESARAFFPSQEGNVLMSLVRFLKEQGRGDLVEGFFRAWAEGRRPVLLERLAGLDGKERLKELALALTDDGFMAEVGRTEDGRHLLRLCNCPMEPLVSVTGEPCRQEIRIIQEVIGHPLDRMEFVPSGGACCSYAVAEKS
jgi:predicted ArsR family transcriptional regulator